VLTLLFVLMAGVLFIAAGPIILGLIVMACLPITWFFSHSFVRLIDWAREDEEQCNVFPTAKAGGFP